MFTSAAPGVQCAQLPTGRNPPPSINVLVLAWEYPPAITGGLGVACKGLCDALAGIPGHSLQIVLPAQRAEKTAEIISSLRSSYDGSSDLISYTFDFANAVANWPSFRKADVIHGHDWLTFSAALQLQRNCDIPFVAHVHSLEVDRTPYKPNPAIVRIEQQAFERASAIIAVSNFTKQRIMRAFGISSSKIRVIHNGASPDFKINRHVPLYQRKKRICFIGRLTTQKAPDRFLSVAAELAKWDANLTFDIVGVGDMYESLKRQIDDSLKEKVVFHGFLSPPQVARVLEDCRLMIMPSRSEPFGIAAIEAMQLGTPVVASQTVGFVEAVPAVTVVDGSSIEALTAASIKLLSDVSFAERQIGRANSELRELTWHQAAVHVANVFKELGVAPRVAPSVVHIDIHGL